MSDLPTTGDEKWQENKPELTNREIRGIVDAVLDAGRAAYTDELVTDLVTETDYIGTPRAVYVEEMRSSLRFLEPYLKGSENEHIRHLWNDRDLMRGKDPWGNESEHKGDWLGLSSLLAEGAGPPVDVLDNAYRTLKTVKRHLLPESCWLTVGSLSDE